MLPCLTLLLLIGPSVCNTTGDSGEELALSAEAGPWVTLILEEIPVPSIQLQLQEGKRSKANQFFGLMGKQVEGIPPIQPERAGYKLGQMAQALLSRRGSSMEGPWKSPQHQIETSATGMLCTGSLEAVVFWRWKAICSKSQTQRMRTQVQSESLQRMQDVFPGSHCRLSPPGVFDPACWQSTPAPH
ncbi:tachykinin-4 isoform X2 [Marmota flaviventris]|uniref:tachykinin-4 isoform X2 n=1 Tax=Marmota flaviventris TaxID=93162 RepID=UPI003A88C73A